MTSIYTQRFINGPLTARASNGSLLLAHHGDTALQIAGLPPHVAEHTAAAFSRAMQAVPDGDGWTYTTKSGVWHISCPMPRIYQAQHDEVTGDGDPAWMFAEASTLIGVMDEIDDQEAEQIEENAA